jgi:AmmeMemoRadiSam system protein B
MVKSIRKAAVAGQFYDANPVTLSNYINELKATTKQSSKNNEAKPRAVILPHAGYLYSGATAVKTLLHTTGHNYQRIVVLAPSHRVRFNGISLGNYSAFATPLGNVEVDTDAVNKLIELNSPLLTTNNQPHEQEHALEVELPLLQELLPEIKIIPGIVGFTDPATVKQLATLLLPLWEPDTLWVISSDFTHYGRAFQYLPFTDNIAENLSKLDLAAAELITKLDLDGFEKYLDRTGATICGAAPIKILLAVINQAQTNGKTITGELIDYTTSAAQSGDYSHCVSYVGISFTQST